MKGKQLWAIAAIAWVSFAGACPDRELREWAENAKREIDQNFANHHQRLCDLEGQTPCPHPDPGSVPEPPPY